MIEQVAVVEPKDHYFTNLLKKRTDRRHNNIILCVGEAGIGKSYAMFKLYSKRDPAFDVPRVNFDQAEFFEVIEGLPKKSQLLIDEPAQSRGYNELCKGTYHGAWDKDGKVDVAKLMLIWKLGRGRAYNLKRLLEEIDTSLVAFRTEPYELNRK